ncbi:MAG: 2-dehydropantoate 2-reductase [Candidatus Desulfofervidus auxilii]|nr:2-dehydropantoate 2-reductase [Candidatus Desulfofervidus auxilii]
MKIAIIGAGAIGGLVAGYLSKEGIDITLIGKKKDVLAIKENGLFIEGVRGKLVIPINVEDKLKNNADFIILAIKTQDIPSVLNDIPKNIPILTVQNGVRAEEILSNYIPKEKIIGSVVMFGATYLSPGKILHNFEGDWIIGKAFSKNDEEVEKLANLLNKAFSIHITEEIKEMKWLKLFLNLNNCLPALIGKSMQETFSDLEICKLSIRLLKEALTVIDKAGIKLKSLPDFPLERLYALTNMPLEESARIFSNIMKNLSKEPLYGSILQSIKRKRPSEIDYINGEIASLSEKIGIDAPLNKKVVEMVHAVEKRGEFFKSEEILNEFRR